MVLSKSVFIYKELKNPIGVVGNAKKGYLWSLSDHKYPFLADKSLPGGKAYMGADILEKPLVEVLHQKILSFAFGIIKIYEQRVIHKNFLCSDGFFIMNIILIVWEGFSCLKK
jgi:hypothetical protein